jgi:type IV pilus assembly protein PilA
MESNTVNKNYEQAKGLFSLIELLIVVAIILIIAAIAIPNLIKSKMAANEASAVGSVRTVNTGEVNYAASCPAVGFSSSLVELNTSAICAGGKGIIDNVLAAGAKSGYTFLYAPVKGGDGLYDTYTTSGTPSTVGTTGSVNSAPAKPASFSTTLPAQVASPAWAAVRPCSKLNGKLESKTAQR